MKLILYAGAFVLTVSMAVFSPFSVVDTARAQNQATFTVLTSISPDEFIRKLTRIHADNPYTKIAFDFDGTAHVEGRLMIIPLSDDCSISGKGMYTLDPEGKLVIKASDIFVSCKRALRLVEAMIGNKIKDYFTIPDVEKMAREEAQEFIALSPEDAALYARLKAIAPVGEGQAVLLGANRELINYMISKTPSRSRADAIIALQDRVTYLRWFQLRQNEEKKYTAGALSVRVAIDWESGKFHSAVIRYPWGEPTVAVSQVLFAGRWVWESVSISGTVEDYNISIRASFKLGNYILEP